MQLLLHFLPNVFSGADVRALCRSVKFFYLSHAFMDLALCTETRLFSSERKMKCYSVQRHCVCNLLVKGAVVMGLGS